MRWSEEDSWNRKYEEDPDVFMKYKKDAVKAAKDLGYGKKVVDRIKKSMKIGEIQRIMISARKHKFDKDLY